MKYPNVTRAVVGTPWAIIPDRLDAIIEVLQARLEGAPFTDAHIAERLEAAAATAGERRGPSYWSAEGDELVEWHASAGTSRPRGTVAVIPVYGTIMPRANLMTAMSGGTTVQGIRAAFREALADETISAIVMEFDSPGGQVGGIEELAAEIRGARGRKPIIATANTTMASAAYYLASGADEVVATPSSIVGSIGIIGAHLDYSRQLDAEGVTPTIIRVPDTKASGFQGFEPLSEEGLAEWRQQAEDYYGQFVSAVAKGRGVGVQAVRDGYGKGGVLTAKRAQDAGLVDRVETFDETLRRAAGGRIPMKVGKQTALVALTAQEREDDWSPAAALDVPEGHLPSEPVGMAEQQDAAQTSLEEFRAEHFRSLLTVR